MSSKASKGTIVDGVQLTGLMVTMLTEHASGDRPVKVSDLETLRALRARGLIRFSHAVRPSRTFTTPRGREVVSALLARMADVLVANAAVRGVR